MRRTVFASLRSHRVRLAMTALAVALGTALMCGSFVFTASLTHSLDALFAQASAGTDPRAAGRGRRRRRGQRPGRAARPERPATAREVRGRPELAGRRAIPRR